MDKLISKIGFLLFLLGAGGMDSQNQIVPAAMVLIGLALIAINAIKENSPVQQPASNTYKTKSK